MAKKSVTDRITRGVIYLVAFVAFVAFAVATLGITASAVKLTVVAVGFLVIWLTTKVRRRRQTDDENSEPASAVSE